MSARERRDDSDSDYDEKQEGSSERAREVERQIRSNGPEREFAPGKTGS